MAGPQEFEMKAVDVKMTDSEQAGMRDADMKLADPQKSKRQDADLEMVDPQKFEENNADVELEVPPQYQADDVDVERGDVEIVDDNSIRHTWLCPGGDPAHCGCPKRPTRRDHWIAFGYGLLIVAALLLFAYGISLLYTHMFDADTARAEAANCTVVYSYANSMGACVNGTKLY